MLGGIGRFSFITHSRFWSCWRVSFRVRGVSITASTIVSITALTIVLEAISPGQSVGLVARDLALEFSEAVYAPNVVTHIPGISNKLAGAFSRFSEPQGSKSIPDCL